MIIWKVFDTYCDQLLLIYPTTCSKIVPKIVWALLKRDPHLIQYAVRRFQFTSWLSVARRKIVTLSEHSGKSIATALSLFSNATLNIVPKQKRLFFATFSLTLFERTGTRSMFMVRTFWWLKKFLWWVWKGSTSQKRWLTKRHMKRIVESIILFAQSAVVITASISQRLSSMGTEDIVSEVRRNIEVLLLLLEVSSSPEIRIQYRIVIRIQLSRIK